MDQGPVLELIKYGSHNRAPIYEEYQLSDHNIRNSMKLEDVNLSVPHAPEPNTGSKVQKLTQTLPLDVIVG